MRSMLNSLSTAEIFLLVVGAAMVFAVGLAVGIRKAVPDIGERKFEDFADGLRVVYELLFALVLAFVIASVLDKFNDAESAVAEESTALSQMVRDNLAFPASDEARFNRALSAYVDAVVDDEWQTMSDGEASPEAAAALESVYALYSEFEPAEGSQSTIYEQSLGHLDAVAHARLARLDIASSSLPTVLVIMLPLGLVLLLVFEYRPRLGARSQTVFMGTLALVVSSTYLLTVVLDYPFSGDVSVSNDPLTSGTLAALVGTGPREPQPGDRPLPLTTRRLEGVWGSDAYGTLVLRRSDDGIRGAYRLANGAVRGRITRDGVFRGRWCEGPTRRPGGNTDSTSDGGLVEWKLVDTESGGRLIVGTWSYGDDRKPDGSFEPDGGWDLRRLDKDDAVDLEKRVRTDPERMFCHER